MTQLIYQTNSYLKEFSAVITAVDETAHAVILDQSAFYPGGGGQPCDTGKLLWEKGELDIVKVKKTPEGVLHFFPESTPLLPVNTKVTGLLDWEHRYQLMRTHTAMHILCGVVFRDYAAQVTGGDMEPLKGRMDFEFESMGKELVAVIEDAVNREIAAAHPVVVDILPRETAFQIPDLIRTKINLLPPGIEFIRVVELKDLDLQADGGTHVANTSEVGHIRVVDYKSKGKINKRIYVEID